MRNTNKKGFTIVELVIVVAVIAILAAVLIPTFSGIIDRAKLSADKKAVQEMNTYIAMEEADVIVEETTPEEMPESTWEQEYMNGIYIAIGIVVLVGLIALAVWLYQRYHNEGMA